MRARAGGDRERLRAREGASLLQPMGAVPESLAAELRQALGLERAVETGTYRGGGAREIVDRYGQALSAAGYPPMTLARV